MLRRALARGTWPLRQRFQLCATDFGDFNRIQLEIVFGSPMVASMFGVVVSVGGLIGLSRRGGMLVMKQIRRRSALVFALFLGVAGRAQAADQAMIDAAKKDERVTWYTTQIIDQFARPAAEAFEKKYGIKVDYLRTDSSELALRIVNEARAGKVQADIFDGTSPTPALKREGLVKQWIPPSAELLPPQYRDRDRYWAATNLYVLTPGFNTELVPKGTEPKTYQDLLDPKWKGKMVWNSAPQTSAGPGFIGTVLADMGEDKGMDYLRALAKQNVTSVKVSARQVLDQVIAGEYSIALQIFNNHAVISAQQGAPSAWIPMNPALADALRRVVDERRAASCRGEALLRFSRLRRRPETLPCGRLHARRSERASARSELAPGRCEIQSDHADAGADRCLDAKVGRNL